MLPHLVSASFHFFSFPPKWAISLPFLPLAVATHDETVYNTREQTFFREM